MSGKPRTPTGGRFATSYGDRGLYADEVVLQRDPVRVNDMAELAEDWLARYLGLGRGQGNIGHADAGFDLVWRGWTIDVKWPQSEPGERRWENKPEYPGLRVPKWKPIKADIYACIIGLDPERFGLYGEWASGWATRREVLDSPVVDLGRKRKASGRPAPFHWLGFDYLHPLWTLRDLKERRAIETD